MTSKQEQIQQLQSQIQKFKQENEILKQFTKKIEKSITKYQNKTVNRKKNNYDFFVPENILSPKRRRKFRILICFNLKKKNARDRNSRFDKNIQNLTTVLDKKKDHLPFPPVCKLVLKAIRTFCTIKTTLTEYQEC